MSPVVVAELHVPAVWNPARIKVEYSFGIDDSWTADRVCEDKSFVPLVMASKGFTLASIQGVAPNCLPSELGACTSLHWKLCSMNTLAITALSSRADSAMSD